MKKHLYFWFLWFILPTTGYSQFFEFGMGIGGAVYYGDLSQESAIDNVKMVRPALGVFGTHHFNKKIGIQIQLNNALLIGDDALSERPSIRYRNLSFRTNITEFSLLGQFNIFGFDPEDDFPFSLYVSSGITGIYFNPKAQLGGTYYRLQPLSTEGQGLPSFPDRKPYKLFQAVIPVIGGIKYAVSPTVNLFIEFGPRFTFTDYLDDVSGHYGNENELRTAKGDIAVQLSDRRLSPSGEPKVYPNGGQRGNPNTKDYYFLGLAGLSVNLDDIVGGLFGDKVHCPKF